MTKLQTFLVSLQEPITVLREHFRQYVLQQLACGQYSQVEQLVKQSQVMNYDGVEFMTALVREIFFSDITDKNFLNPTSTAILVRDGIPADTAKQLALELFKITLDAIAGALPGVRFGSMSKAVSCDFVDEFDMMFSFHTEDILGLKESEA